MAAFLNDRLQKLERLLTRSSVAWVKYRDLDLDLAAEVIGFLDEAISNYRSLGMIDAENELLALNAQYVTARRGTNPLTLERVTSHRREMERSIALHVLSLSAERLRADFGRDRQSLDEAMGLLRPIVLIALHHGLLDPVGAAALGQAEIGALWHVLLGHPESSLAARQVAMLVSHPDIQILLAELIAAAS